MIAQIDSMLGTLREMVRINPRLARLGRSPLSGFRDQVEELRRSGKPVYDFSVGDPREPTAMTIREALADGVAEVSQYPDTRGQLELRQAIAAYLEHRFGTCVDPHTQILVTSGSKEAIFLAPLAFVDAEKNERVIYPSPGYPIYERGSVLSGAASSPIRLSGDFVFRPEMVPEEFWTDSKLLWLCSPHNPTGSVTPRSVLAEWYEITQRHGVLIAADECYSDLYDPGSEPPASILEIAGPEMSGCLAYLSLSKRSGMTGYRCGAIVGDPEAIEALFALRTSTGTAPPDYTQAAAVAAWSDPDHIKERQRIFAQKRQLLSQGWVELGFQLVSSQAGLYLWIKVEDDMEMAELLLTGGVVVSPGRFFGTGGEGYIRLALVPTLAECSRAMDAIATSLRQP